jgi:hypothetical protein
VKEEEKNAYPPGPWLWDETFRRMNMTAVDALKEVVEILNKELPVKTGLPCQSTLDPIGEELVVRIGDFKCAFSPLVLMDRYGTNIGCHVREMVDFVTSEALIAMSQAILDRRDKRGLLV